MEIARLMRDDGFAPCFLGDIGNGTYSLGLTEFDSTAAIFEEMGADGGGYGWHAVVDALIHMNGLKIKRKLNYDPEASMFVVVSKDLEALKQVAHLIRSAMDDPDVLREALRRADPDLLD
jgi:immunity protein 51 of polymorphic toxin system